MAYKTNTSDAVQHTHNTRSRSQMRIVRARWTLWRAHVRHDRSIHQHTSHPHTHTFDFHYRNKILSTFSTSSSLPMHMHDRIGQPSPSPFTPMAHAMLLSALWQRSPAHIMPMRAPIPGHAVKMGLMLVVPWPGAFTRAFACAKFWRLFARESGIRDGYWILDSGVEYAECIWGVLSGIDVFMVLRSN